MWDGINLGEVLAVEPPTRLSYTWGVTGETHTVTWTLQDLGDGTVNLHLEQTSIAQPHGLADAKHGWTGWCHVLEKLLAQ